MHTYAFKLQLYHDPSTRHSTLYTQRAIHEFEYTASFLPKARGSAVCDPSPTRPHVRDREAWRREARAEARDRQRSGQSSTCDGLPSRPYAILR